MYKKRRICLIAMVLVVGLIYTNYQTANAAVRSWNVGDEIKWGMATEVISLVADYSTNLSLYNEYVYQQDVIWEITSIDTFAKIFDYDQTTYTDKDTFTDTAYSCDSFVFSNLGPANFITAEYSWDYVTDQPVCTNVDSLPNFWNLIEPNWTTMNNGFRYSYDEEHIFYSLPCPYNSTIYNFTTGDLLSDIDFTLMGDDNIDDAFPKLTDTNTAWSFSFDLSNYLMAEVWNGSMDVYVPYEVCTIEYSIAYQDGGVMESYLMAVEYYLNSPMMEQWMLTDTEYILGGNEKPTRPATETASFNNIMIALSAITCCSILVIKLRKKKR